MINKPLSISFHNQSNPKSTFDLLRIEELFERETVDHSIEEVHKLDFFIILFVTDGVGRHTIDFTDYPYKKGSLLTIRKDQLHKFHKNKGVKGFLLLFTDEFLISYLEEQESQKSLELFNELLGSPKIQLRAKTYQLYLQIIHRMVQEYEDSFDEFSLGIIRSELHILVSKLFRLKSLKGFNTASSRFLQGFVKLQALVEKKVTETRRVTDYANMMNVSTKTLNTISRSVLNKSAKEFIDDIATKQIKRLLINTSLSVKEIAYRSGFEETSNLYKYFKRQTGQTPEQFRLSLR